MSGNKKAILDSNVIIDLAKNEIESTFLVQYSELCMSIISYIEVLGYDFGDDIAQKEKIIEWIATLPIENLNILIANQAIEYRSQKKIKLPDALILATARFLDADLITSNESDFKNLDEKMNIIVPIRK
jgi:hypothetical protein